MLRNLYSGTCFLGFFFPSTSLVWSSCCHGSLFLVLITLVPVISEPIALVHVILEPIALVHVTPIPFISEPIALVPVTLLPVISGPTTLVPVISGPTTLIPVTLVPVFSEPIALVPVVLVRMLEVDEWTVPLAEDHKCVHRPTYPTLLASYR